MPADLRSYLKDLGDKLLEIDAAVDPVEEAPELCSESERPIIFNNLKGYENFRLCDILVKSRATQAVALGCQPNKVVQTMSNIIHEKGPTRAKMVTDGPVKEVKLLGKDADLTKLPIPIHSIGDGGRYIGSAICITKDPETGLRNEAIIRTQIKGPRHTGFYMVPRHNWRHIQKNWDKNEPTPMAYAIGLHPAYELLCNYSGRHDGYDELELGASALGEPIEMVKCETIDLEVPAWAEIVIEGLVPPNVLEPEGPFGEFTNYKFGGEGDNPVWDITAITMRKDRPIYRHMQATRFTDHQPLVVTPMEATIYRRLQDVQSHSEIHEVYFPPWASMFLGFIQMTPGYEGQARDVLLASLTSPNLHPKIMIAVDEDVDVYDPRDVFWAMSTRVNPAKDVIVIPHERNHPLDLYIPELIPGDVFKVRVGGKMAIDATKPSTMLKEERAKYERARPTGYGKVTLDMFMKAFASV